MTRLSASTAIAVISLMVNGDAVPGSVIRSTPASPNVVSGAPSAVTRTMTGCKEVPVLAYPATSTLPEDCSATALLLIKPQHTGGGRNTPLVAYVGSTCPGAATA